MAYPSGWPCVALPQSAPPVDDKQSAPSSDELLPQVLALTPRGPAWGTDEAGDGKGASPVMLQVWTAVAAWVASVNRTEFRLATQAAFPSAIEDTFALFDWEEELGLPDRCLGLNPTAETRKNAVRSKFGAAGNASTSYFLCLARSAGYNNLRIEEPKAFACGESELGDGAEELGPPLLDATWVVHVPAQTTQFELGDGPGEMGVDPLSGFVRDDVLECILNQSAPPHTNLVVHYFAPFGQLNFSVVTGSQFAGV